MLTMMRVNDPRSKIEATRAAVDELYGAGLMGMAEYVKDTQYINIMEPCPETDMLCEAIWDRINQILDTNDLPYYFGLHPHPETLDEDWIGFFGSEVFFPAQDEG